MNENQRDRLRKLAESLKSADSTSGNLEGVMAVAVLDCLGELEQMREVLEEAKGYVIRTGPPTLQQSDMRRMIERALEGT